MTGARLSDVRSDSPGWAPTPAGWRSSVNAEWTSRRRLTQLRQLEIETPSWAYGDSGTRFHVYPWPGAARTVHERIADAALVHALTGACPSVAIHIPWDRVDDWSELAHFAESQGVRIGAVNPNLFQEDDTASAASATRIPQSGVRRSIIASSASRSRRPSARRS